MNLKLDSNLFGNKILTFTMVMIWFLLPLKYGGNINPTFKSTWNVDIFSWIVGSWPVFTFPLISAIALSILFYNINKVSKSTLYFSILMSFPGIMILIASIIGLINTTEKDVAYLFLTQILAINTLVISSVIFMDVYPKSKQYFLVFICVGFIFSSAHAYNQKYFLHSMIQDQLEEKLNSEEQNSSKEFILLKSTKRYGGFFPYSNHLGAHLILLFPICIVLAWRSGYYVKPYKLSSFLFTSLIILFLMKTLQLSGSLSAFLILTIIMIGAFWFWIKKSNFLKKKLIKHRIIYLIFITLALIFLILYTERYTSIESKILSLQFRFDTWESAIKIFKDYPLTGAGMGEFYNYHIQNMKSGGEITRFAHNLALNLLSQCGLFGGIAALSMLFHPIFLLFLVKKEKLIIGSKSTYIATFLGGIAWSLHSLLNFNIQVPATICTFLILPSFSLSFPKNRKVLPIKNNIALSFCCLILIGFSLIPTTRLSGEKKYKILEKLIENGASKSEIYEIGEMAITSLSNSPYPTSRIALFALHEGDYEIAINKLKESIKRTPHRSSYHYWIAYVYAKIGKIDESYSSIESALFWYPSNKNYIQLKEYLDALKSQ